MAIFGALNNVRVVLSHTTHPGNIGAAARALKTMGLARLYLVNPKCFPDPSGKAQAMAAGADDVLENVTINNTLLAAINDCQLVIGTSARERSIPWPLLNPRECAEKIISTVKQQQHVAILFGREHSGLNNEELQKCHYHIQIPTNPEYRSLNLAAAVQVLCYELRMTLEMAEKKTSKQVQASDYANTAEVEYYYEHLERVLKKVGFISKKHPNRIMQRMRKLYHRARPSKIEISILRGMLAEIEKKITAE